MRGILAQVAKTEGTGTKPVVIWVCDQEATRTNRQLKEWIFDDEILGLGLNRCDRLQVVIQSMPMQKLAGALAKKEPHFYFYDPSATYVTHIEGADAKSLVSFSQALEKAWDASYEMSIRSYSGKMRKILDKLDKLSKARQESQKKAKSAAAMEKNLAKFRKADAALVLFRQ